MSSLAYLNGKFLDQHDAVVPVDDRGFLFGDGIYEVTRAREGVLLEVARHVRRLTRGVAALDLPFAVERARELPSISERLLRENDLMRGDALVYWQVTRGAVSPRTHVYPPAGTPPTVYVSATSFTAPHDRRADGVRTIVVPDQRWARCDLKTVNLLPNVMAKQRAAAAGAFEAIFVRDGVITEGAATSVFGVLDGVVRTYPLSNYILPGVTREVVLEVAAEMALPVRQEPLLADDLARVSELFLTGTTNDVMPVVEVDGRRVGDGHPGPTAGRLYAGLMARWHIGD